MLHDLVRAMLKVAPALDLWPVAPMISVSPAAKSYHFGASFPHGSTRSARTTDRTGRLAAWDRIHLVDASVFSEVPATTFTLTIMANAHRIASEAVRAGGDHESWARRRHHRCLGLPGFGTRRRLRVRRKSRAVGSFGRRPREPTTTSSTLTLRKRPMRSRVSTYWFIAPTTWPSTKRADIWRSNVFSTIALFDRALSEGVDRTITLSSMSAYPGTRQHYGRAKLAVEGAARARGMCIVRPGLVYGPAWRGMAGTLRRLAALPVLPDFGPEARQFTVAEHDFAVAIVALAGAEHAPTCPGWDRPSRPGPLPATPDELRGHHREAWASFRPYATAGCVWGFAGS